MAHKRKNFTDRQKAEIYVRDRATCSFSGANLWLLDSPLRPGVQLDWVDHILPSAQGGGSSIDNGVCASHTYNAKKRHNSADNFYLFEEGLPTCGYFEIFGPLPPEQEARLRRLSRLATEDWFLNRAIGWTVHGFYDRCTREFYDTNYVRNADYWYGAAYRKLQVYQKTASADSLEERGVVVQPDEIARQWLALRRAGSKDAFLKIAEELFPAYRNNYIVWAEYFWDSETPAQTAAAHRKAMDSNDTSSDVRECVDRDYRMRSVSAARPPPDSGEVSRKLKP